MPHVNGGGGGGGEDLASSDEMRVYNHEGEEREETKGSENLTEDKSDLIIQGEEKCLPPIAADSYPSPKNAPSRSETGSVGGKPVDSLGHDRSSLNMGYIVTPYPYPNGNAGPIPVSMSNKVGMVSSNHPPSPLSFVMYNDSFGQPPPAHMGIPPVHIDPKTGLHNAWPTKLGIHRLQGIPRPPMYPLSTPGQYPHPMFASDFAQWHSPSMYPITTATGYRGPYPTSLVTTAGIPRFSPASLLSAHPGLPPHPAISHPAIVTPGPKQEIGASVAQENHLSYYFLPPLSSANGMLYNPSYHGNQLPSNPSTPSPDLMYQLSLDLRSMKSAQQNIENRHSGIVDLKGMSNNNNNNNNNNDAKSDSNSNNHDSKKRQHIKKPLNAFMLYMKEMRAKVVAECTLKESAAINQILGRRWHALGREEQAKYYELARKERQLHMQLYPGWSARDNYAQQGKKKKRKRDKSADGDGNNPKKCRARYGLDQQGSWCKPCRRKKKCIRYVDGSDSASIDIDDNLGSVGSSGLGTPDSKSLADSDQEPQTSSEISLSSPPVPAESLDAATKTTTPPSNSVCPATGSNSHGANNPFSVSSLMSEHKMPAIKRDPETVEGNSLSATVTSTKAAAESIALTAPAIASVT